MNIKNYIKQAMIVTSLTAIFVANISLAKDKIVTMKIASWLPPSHIINATFWPTFIKQLEKATDGRVTGEIEYNLAPASGLINLIEDGGADVSWIFHGYTPGRFVTSKLPELPGLEGSSAAASVGYWRAYEKYLKKANEYKGVTVIGLTVHDESYLLMAEPIKSIADIRGKKLRLPGGVGTDVGKSFGAVPILVPAPKIYETIANRIADGVLLPSDLFGALKLSEVTPNGYSVPGGFYRGTFAIVMNNGFLSKLSDKDKKAVLALTGEPLSKLIGQIWDKGGVDGLNDYIKAGGKITPLSKNDVDLFNSNAKNVQKSVIDEVNALDIDGQAAFDLIKLTMKSYK